MELWQPRGLVKKVSILKNKLSGILLTKEGIKRVFEEGKIIDVERT